MGIGFNNGDQNRILPITNPVTNSTQRTTNTTKTCTIIITATSRNTFV